MGPTQGANSLAQERARADAVTPASDDTEQRAEQPDHRSPLSLCGLLFRFRSSVTCDAVEKVPTGGGLTLFEAVDRARSDFLLCRSSPVGMSGVT
jgi:hypothetical protein